MPTDKQKKYTEELYGKITPYLMGPQANQETIDKAHSIYDIEAVKQKERNLENANAQGEAFGLARLSTPVYQPKVNEVPIIENSDEILAQQPKVEGPTKKTGAAWLSDYVNSLKKPITPEEEARRERAARAVQGVAGLGNVMTVFSNLAFTGKGAPSQTLPTQQADAMGKEITSWQDKLAVEREKYAAAALGAKTQQWKMEQEERRYADQLKQQGIENTIKLGNLEMSRAKLAHDMDYAKQMLDLRVKELMQNGENAKNAHIRAMKELGIQEQRLGLAKDELKARQDGSYYTGKKTEDWVPVNTHVGNMEIDNNKLKGVNLAQYAEMLQQNGEDELARALASLNGDEKSLEQLRQTIGKALVNPSNTAIVEDMIKKGILRPAGASAKGGTNGVTSGWNPDNKNDDSPIKKKK